MQIATVLVPFLAAVLGALVYALAANGKLSEMGRILYFAGVLWLIYVLSHVSLHISA